MPKRPQGLKSRQIVTGVVAGLAGLLFVASGITAAGTNLRNGGVDDLRSLVVNRATHVEQLQVKTNTLQIKVNELSAAKISPALLAHLTVLENQAGLAPVTGSALQIVLDDAPRTVGQPLPDGVAPDDVVVHQQDVQAVVNAMWRGGAIAIQVMDQRLISTSAIRCVGNTLLLQGRVYSPPFKIIGVGNVTDLQNAVNSEPGVQVYKEYVDRLGLGWKESIVNSTTVPAWEGSIN